QGDRGVGRGGGAGPHKTSPSIPPLRSPRPPGRPPPPPPPPAPGAGPAPPGTAESPMFEYVCPKCRLPHALAELRGPQIVSCPECGQRLHVVPEDQTAASLASGERLVAPPAKAPWWGGPLAPVLGVGAGAVAAGLLVGASFL